MKVNNLEPFLEKMRGGKVALGCCVTLADPAVSEIACAAGFDFTWIDGEHGQLDRNMAMLHLMAVKGTGVAPLYRVPCCDHTEIKRVIDFAPAGIIVPMVMNAADAARVVAACRYPCHGGTRGCGYRRGLDYGAADVSEYLEASRHDPLVIVQIEHIDAVRDLDAILSVPGSDSILVGPYDLSMSMGRPGCFDDLSVRAAIDEVCRKVRAHGLLLGAYAEDGFAAWRARGVNYLGVKNDTNALLSGFRAAISRAQDRWAESQTASCAGRKGRDA